MEKVAGTGGHAGSRQVVPFGPCTVALAACMAACTASAQEAAASAEVLLAEARTEAPVRMHVQASTLPRLESQDGGFQAPRVDVSLFPSRAYGFGAVLGMSGFAAQQPPGLAALKPSVDFGVRWNRGQLDVTAWRRMSTAEDAYTLMQMQQPVYGARVEMNLKPARTGIVALDRGFIGLQLQSGARITIKRKDGRPMVYYRTAF